MTLSITSLEAYQFRNYSSLSLQDLGKVNICIGENAVGKTNLLEAIHLATSCRSFRHASMDQMMLFNASLPQCRVAVITEDENRQLLFECCMEQNKRTYKINGKAKRSSEVRGILPTVVFTPDDLHLVKGSHCERRDALDVLGEQLKPNYQSVRKNYETALKQKNKLLKEGIDKEYLASLNEVLLATGAQLVFYRWSLCKRLVPLIIEEYAALSRGREQLQCSYVPSWELHGKLPEDASVTYKEKTLTREEIITHLRAALDNRLGDEIIRQRSIIGPHMDAVEFTLDGKPAGDFGSQGQQRSIVLAWKLAEVKLIKELLGVSPVLLLDDVMSELDGLRRQKLEECIQDVVQSFITTTNLGYFSEEMLQQAKVIQLPLG